MAKADVLPANRPPRPLPTRYGGGFTLIELLMTVSIAAVIMSLAIPSFADFIVRSRSDSQVSALINGLNLARSEAVLRATPVSITPMDGANWRSGWRVWIDQNNDDSFTAGTDTQLQLTPPLTGSASIPAPGLTFDPLGSTTITAISYCLNSDYSHLDRQIAVDALGRVRTTRSPCP